MNPAAPVIKMFLGVYMAASPIVAWPLSVVIFPGKSPKPILSIKIPWPQIHLWLNHKEREGGGRGAKKVIATETERKECTCIQIVCNPHNGNKNVTKNT
jgi:hypothetical protein